MTHPTAPIHASLNLTPSAAVLSAAAALTATLIGCGATGAVAQANPGSPTAPVTSVVLQPAAVPPSAQRPKPATTEVAAVPDAADVHSKPPHEPPPSPEAWVDAPKVAASKDGLCHLRRLDRWLLVVCKEVSLPIPRTLTSSVEDSHFEFFGNLDDLKPAHRLYIEPGSMHDLLFRSEHHTHYLFLSWPQDASEPTHYAIANHPSIVSQGTVDSLPPVSPSPQARPAPADWVRAVSLRVPGTPKECAVLALGRWIRVRCDFTQDAVLTQVAKTAGMGQIDVNHFVYENPLAPNVTLEFQMEPGTNQAVRLAWGEAFGIPVEFLDPAVRKAQSPAMGVGWDPSGQHPTFVWR